MHHQRRVLTWLIHRLLYHLCHMGGGDWRALARHIHLQLVHEINLGLEKVLLRLVCIMWLRIKHIDARRVLTNDFRSLARLRNRIVMNICSVLIV